MIRHHRMVSKDSGVDSWGAVFRLTFNEVNLTNLLDRLTTMSK